MKQLRFLFCTLVLFAGLGLTSCNEPSNDGARVWAGVVKVNADQSFTNISGVRLVPTDIVTPISASMAYIYCRVVGEVPSDDTYTLNVTLLTEPQSVDGTLFVAAEPGAEGDITANTAIYTLNVEGQSPVFFNSQILILPVAYFIKDVSNDIDLTAELAKHKFELVYYTNSITSGDTELKLYLRHVITDDVDPARYSQKAWTLRAYDLSFILQEFKSKSGNDKPSSVAIYAEENSISDEIGTGYSQTETYTLTYSFK